MKQFLACKDLSENIKILKVQKESVFVELCTLQRQNTEISKYIFPEKEYRGLSPNFHIHASVSDL